MSLVLFKVLLTYTSCSVLIEMITAATVGRDSLAGVGAVSVDADLPSWAGHAAAQALIDICKSTTARGNSLLSEDLSSKILSGWKSFRVCIMMKFSRFGKLLPMAEYNCLCHLASPWRR